MSVRRGDVVLVKFPFSSGTASKVRPALVVQCDRNNQRLASTLVAMITSTTQRVAKEPTQLLIDLRTAEGQDSGLLHDSAVKCENLATIDQQVILRKIGYLAPATMGRINDCIN